MWTTSRDTLNGEHSVWEEITAKADFVELGKRKVPSRAYVAAFNFKGRTSRSG